ncbi:MAG: PepSY domain-containing protein [Pseudomonadota bacterium]|nr:PepSY domain-containing protein [Pseudomonadota bacterium]
MNEKLPVSLYGMSVLTMRSGIRMAMLAVLWLSATVAVAGESAEVTETIPGHNEVYRLRQAGEILPLDRILRISRERFPGELLEAEIEREGNRLIYEIAVAGRDGSYHEFRYDAATGEPLGKEDE